MTLGNRLKQFADENFSTVGEFTKHLGINRENAYRYFNNTVAPGSEVLIRLAQMGCDINWLLTGKVENQKKQNISGIELDYVPIDEAEINKMPKFLEYSVFGSIPAGKGEFVDFTDWIQKMVIDYSPQSHALLVVDQEFGYSMTPIIQPGDIALFSFYGKIHNNRPVAAKWGETKGALKIVNFNPINPENIILLSSNSSQTPIYVRRNEVQLYNIVAFFLLGRDVQ